MRLRARVDTNHVEIVAALRRAGWLVSSLARQGRGCPDLICYKAGAGLRLVEVKTKRGSLTDDQQGWVDAGWPVYVVRSAEEALTVVR